MSGHPKDCQSRENENSPGANRDCCSRNTEQPSREVRIPWRLRRDERNGTHPSADRGVAGRVEIEGVQQGGNLRQIRQRGSYIDLIFAATQGVATDTWQKICRRCA